MKKYMIYKVRENLGTTLIGTCFKEVDVLPFATKKDAEKYIVDILLKIKGDFYSSTYTILPIYK